jgi:hypothetical protein
MRGPMHTCLENRPSAISLQIAVRVLSSDIRSGEGLSIEQALRRQRGSHAQELLLMLPTLANWSRDPSSAATAVASPQRWSGVEP